MNLLPLGDPAIFRPDVPNIPGCQGLYGEGEDRHIASFQHSVGIQLSPNPVSDNLSIKFTKPFSGNIEIFDLTGKNLGIFRNIKLLYEHDVPTSQLSPGVYLLSVTSETGERTVMKFIVSR
jgi:hypothetical protein